LCPTLERDRVVVMDNFSAHKAERVRELIEGKGCELVYLPPYSSPEDFNAIEHKRSPSSRATSGRHALAADRRSWRSYIGQALSTITASEAEGYFAHCGYRAVLQSL
jgi:transposase